MLQALMTALLSGLFSGFVMFGLGEKRDRLNDRAKKLEEAFIAYAEWAELTLSYYERVFQLVQPVSDDFKQNDDIIGRSVDSARNKARSLLYFHVNDYDQIESRLSSAQEPLIEKWTELRTKNLYLNPDEPGYHDRQREIIELARQFTPLLKDIVWAQRIGMKQIAQQGRELIDRPYMFDFFAVRLGTGRRFSWLKSKPLPPLDTPSDPRP